MAEFEVYARGVAVNLTPFCRMCMRLATERRLVYADSYRILLTRVLNINNTVVPANARLCYVCDAMVRRCSRLLDLLLQSQQLAVLMTFKPIDRQNNVILADQEVVQSYERHVKGFESVSKLCITETLNIDSQERDPIDLTDDVPPAPPPYNLAGVLETAKEKLVRARTADRWWRRWAARSHDAANPPARADTASAATDPPPPTSIGNNIVLIPAKSNLVGNNILLQQQPNSSLQLVNQGINNSIQLVNQPNNTIQLLNQLQSVPVLNQVTNNVQVFNRDSSEALQGAGLAELGAGGGWQLVQLVDNAHSQSTAVETNVTQLSHVAKVGGGGGVGGRGGGGAAVETKDAAAAGDWESSVERVEDNECIAIIETDISWRSGNSEGTSIVPDLEDSGGSKLASALLGLKGEAVKRERIAAAKRESIAAANRLKPVPLKQLRPIQPRPTARQSSKKKQQKSGYMTGGKMVGPITSTAPIMDETTEPLMLYGGANLKLVSPPDRAPSPQQHSQPRILAVSSQGEDARAAEVIDVDGESYRDRGGYGALQPQLKDKDAVDWEDKIPMEVITYADEVSSPAPQTSERQSQGDVRPTYSRRRLKKKLKLV